jgi:hypothetical protein
MAERGEEQAEEVNYEVSQARSEKGEERVRRAERESALPDEARVSVSSIERSEE